MTQHLSTRPPPLAASASAAPAAPEQPYAKAKRLALRDSLKAEVARVQQRAEADAGLSDSDVARQFATQRQRVQEMGDPLEPTAVTAVQLAMADTELAEPVVVWIASKHRRLVHVAPANVHGDNHLARNAALTPELVDVIREFAVALADNRIDAAERLRLLQEIREARAALDEAEAALLCGGVA